MLIDNQSEIEELINIGEDCINGFKLRKTYFKVEPSGSKQLFTNFKSLQQNGQCNLSISCYPEELTDIIDLTSTMSSAYDNDINNYNDFKDITELKGLVINSDSETEDEVPDKKDEEEEELPDDYMVDHFDSDFDGLGQSDDEPMM